MRLVFLGPPGAGKGTQARILQERAGIVQISTGDILRHERSEETALGRQADAYMRRGELVPDALVVAMIEKELARHPDGFAMDGFPRTVAQAEAFDELLARRGWPLDHVILFKADRDALIARLAARWTNPRTGRTYNALTQAPAVAGTDDDDGGPLVQRDDDRPETVAHRLDVYEAQTAPLVEYYRRAGTLAEVNALDGVDAVADAVAAAIGLQRAAK